MNDTYIGNLFILSIFDKNDIEYETLVLEINATVQKLSGVILDIDDYTKEFMEFYLTIGVVKIFIVISENKQDIDILQNLDFSSETIMYIFCDLKSTSSQIIETINCLDKNKLIVFLYDLQVKHIKNNKM